MRVVSAHPLLGRGPGGCEKLPLLWILEADLPSLCLHPLLGSLWLPSPTAPFPTPTPQPCLGRNPLSPAALVCFLCSTGEF